MEAKTKEQAIQTLTERGQHEAAQAVKDGAFVAIIFCRRQSKTSFAVMEPTRTTINPTARDHSTKTFATYKVACGQVGMRHPGDLFKGQPIGPERTAAVHAYYAGLADMCHQIILAFHPSLMNRHIKKDGYEIELMEQTANY